MFAEQMLRMLAGLLVGLWVARYMGPSQFGAFNYAIAFAALFNSISKLGLDSIVVRELVSDPSSYKVYLGTAFWSKIVGSLVMMVVLFSTLHLISSDEQSNIYILIIASASLFQSLEVVDFYFQSRVLLKYVSICKIAQLLISSLVKLYLIYIDAELFWFVLVILIDQIILGIAYLFAYGYHRVNYFFYYFDYRVCIRLLRSSWSLIVTGIVITIYMKIDQVMIKEMLGEKDVGIYSAATRLSELFYFVPMLIANSIFPSIVNAKAHSVSLFESRIQKLYILMIVSSVSIIIPMTFLGDLVVVSCYGEAYREAGAILILHIWATIFVFIGVASDKWAIAEGKQRYIAINTFAGAVINIVLNIILIPMYGIKGAAVATLIAYAFAAYLMNFVFKDTRDNFYRLSKAFCLGFVK